MSTEERKHPAGKRLSGVDSPAAQGPAEQVKKPYRKPVLSKYEQLHGIGIGGSV